MPSCGPYLHRLGLYIFRFATSRPRALAYGAVLRTFSLRSYPRRSASCVPRQRRGLITSFLSFLFRPFLPPGSSHKFDNSMTTCLALSARVGSMKYHQIGKDYLLGGSRMCGVDGLFQSLMGNVFHNILHGYYLRVESLISRERIQS